MTTKVEIAALEAALDLLKSHEPTPLELIGEVVTHLERCGDNGLAMFIQGAADAYFEHDNENPHEGCQDASCSLREAYDEGFKAAREWRPLQWHTYCRCGFQQSTDHDATGDACPECGEPLQE